MCIQKCFVVMSIYICKGKIIKIYAKKEETEYEVIFYGKKKTPKKLKTK